MTAVARMVDTTVPDSRAIPARDRLIVALDVPTVEEAQKAVDEIGDAVDFYKIGMQLQFAGGLSLARELVQNGKKVFLDSKLLDIDQTVTSAVHSIAGMGVTFLTVHGNGKTIRAAMAGRGDSDLRILSVTVLTNLDAYDIQDFGFDCNVEELVLSRAKKALEAGADGVIASGAEAKAIRKIAGHKLTIVTPGIRPDGADVDDQKRIVTPSEAISEGADYLVVGRPIMRSPNRREAAQEIVSQIDAALEATTN